MSTLLGSRSERRVGAVGGGVNWAKFRVKVSMEPIAPYQVQAAASDFSVDFDDPTLAIRFARERSIDGRRLLLSVHSRVALTFQTGRLVEPPTLYWSEADGEPIERLRAAWDAEARTNEPVYRETMEQFFERLPWHITQGWVQAAVRCYQQINVPQAQSRYRSALRLLNSTLPQEYVGKVVMIAEQVGYLGEDLWVVDGVLQHPAHERHLACGQYAVLTRGAQAFCGECQREVRPNEVSLFS